MFESLKDLCRLEMLEGRVNMIFGISALATFQIPWIYMDFMSIICLFSVVYIKFALA
jgi:hypothetical protein